MKKQKKRKKRGKRRREEMLLVSFFKNGFHGLTQNATALQCVCVCL